MKVTKAEQTEAKDRILAVIGDNPAPRVYTILRHVSQSGMARDISVKAIDHESGDLVDISYSVSKLIGWSLRQKGHNAIRVTGCGMDMGFHLVSVLSWNLYGAEGTLKQEWAQGHGTETNTVYPLF